MNKTVRKLLGFFMLVTWLAPQVIGASAMAYGQIVPVVVQTWQSPLVQSASLPIVIRVAQSTYGSQGASGSGKRMIPPSVALRRAMRYAPGSQGLGVRLIRGPRLLYAVKLKSGNQIYRVLVDARTGRIVGR